MSRCYRRLFVIVVVGLVATGCSSSGGDPFGDPGPDADAGDPTDAPPEGWHSLVDYTWNLANLSEDYFCIRKTLDRDVYIAGFRSVSPDGTHHEVLTVGGPSGPDGAEKCNSFENHLSLMFGSGVGTPSFEMPDGVAVKIKRGQQLLLNLHLFNASESELSGTSGIEILEIAADDVEHVAEAVLMGPFDLNIGPGEQDESGSCTMSSEGTAFAVFPHMHYLGTKMKVDFASGGASTTVHDAPYDFEQQQIYSLDTPMDFSVGDQVDVTCSYLNHTGGVVRFGESSNDEMCLAGVFYYPAVGAAYICSDDAPF